MDFKSPYVHILRDRNPRLFNQLARGGQLNDYLQKKSVEAHGLLDQLLASEPKGVDGFPKDIQAESLAKERVMAHMVEDIPLPELKEPTIASSPEL